MTGPIFVIDAPQHGVDPDRSYESHVDQRQSQLKVSMRTNATGCAGVASGVGLDARIPSDGKHKLGREAFASP